MESRQGGSTGFNCNESPGTSGLNRIRTWSRSLQHQGYRAKRHARSNSVGSLDRIFNTRGSDEPPIRIAGAPALSLDEKNFTDRTHGISEIRDDFFDAVFLPLEDLDEQALIQHAEETLPLAFRRTDPFSLIRFFPRQCHEAWSVICKVTTTKSGVKLLKSFLGFFISYIICLIPITRAKLGRYAYITAISAIMNHSGRTLGAQVDGTVLTTIGTAIGLGWGAFGLWVSTATATAQIGFGAILALFLFIQMFVIACLRSYYIRTYQLVMCAGIAISYTCLAGLTISDVSWSRLLDYGIPWLIGQGVCLVVCTVVAPDAGSYPLAMGLHQIFGIMLDGIPPIQDTAKTRRRLAQAFVSMSQVYRDLVIDFSITIVSPKDALILRNSVQTVLRTFLSLRSETSLFEVLVGDIPDRDDASHQECSEFVIEVGESPGASDSTESQEIVDFITESLASPTKNLLQSMEFALKSCDAALMETCGYRRYLENTSTTTGDVHSALVSLREHIAIFNTQQEAVLASERLSRYCYRFPNVLRALAFCRPVHQAARSIESLTSQLDKLQQQQPKHPRFHLPSYPLRKAIHRTNAQVRHDRGGVTAGSYFRSLYDIAKLIKKIKSRDYHPLPKNEAPADGQCDAPLEEITADDLNDRPESRKAQFLRRLWALLHRMQGFETRFGFKAALATSLLSIPAYLAESHFWWDRYEAWWGVVMAWLIMGPRTGGNVQDLFSRAFCAVLGTLWAGLSYVAGNGNPYVTAAFAAIYMLPMMYRYTQSTHTRSGLVGCLSFTAISLSDIFDPELLDSGDGKSSLATDVATKGAIMVFGVIASVMVNWLLWPFVARHELRKGLASMIFNCSIVYRCIISQYVYCEDGVAPTERDIEASDILEGRLREGFVRLRQLLGLTRHEIRLRAAFDPLPYSALISACEQFFDHIVALRQSSLLYHSHSIRADSGEAMELLSYRRDEIATVLTNLYVLAGALRDDRQLPKYLPSAVVSRKRLLDRMFELEKEHAASENYNDQEERRDTMLKQIYNYSYNDGLTGCVEQARQLEKYTKIIVGEQG
ncbi:hypothetical protein F5Y14DRAFT_399221 [Nemania sp. NC0429]|nr:hypothetical protein F5Y14DRAFT_399221 [Nemania sp. NC0429]